MPDAAYISIDLLARDGTVRGTVVLDEIDRRMTAYRWHYNGLYATRGVVREGRSTSIYMHREIMGLVPGDGLQVDHINGNKLDNRRANLRICNHAQNHQNTPAHPRSTSRHRGVSWCKRTERWVAQVTLNGTNHFLGRHADEQQAAAAAAAFRAAHMTHSVERS